LQGNSGLRGKDSKRDLVEADGFAHTGLDEERLDILPVLFEERNQKVDRKHDVAKKLILSHLDMTNSDAEAEDLLQLELDGGFKFIGLLNKVVGMVDWGRELSSLVEAWAEETGNLLDEGLGGEEGIVLFGKLLNELLVLVKLLEVLHSLEVHASSLGLIDMKGVSENANAHLGTRNVWKLDGARETLITLRIIVFEADLKLDCLLELAGLLLRGEAEQGAHGFSHS